ncbi:hypothetical protein HAX54_000039 [Datura stramonium]|uniref:Uncharacterized protein n=1 Tax=Datura stramonium TaxID=4076 RepID=A0ABS8RFQ8_DATST|nr:hypothetical protein [Datura stramonium]
MLHQINLNHGTRSSPILLSDDEESKSSSKKDCKVDKLVQNVVQKDKNTRKKILDDSEFLKFAMDFIANVDDHDKLTAPKEKEHVPVKETLPLIFRFEDIFLVKWTFVS